MKCASKKVELSFICERAQGQAAAKRCTENPPEQVSFRLRSETDIHIESIYREKHL
jgi:hypothetical protein